MLLLLWQQYRAEAADVNGGDRDVDGGGGGGVSVGGGLMNNTKADGGILFLLIVIKGTAKYREERKGKHVEKIFVLKFAIKSKMKS